MSLHTETVQTDWKIAKITPIRTCFNTFDRQHPKKHQQRPGRPAKLISKEKKQKVEPDVESPVIDLKTEPVDVKPKRVYNKKPKTWEEGFQEVLKAKEEEQEQTNVSEEIVIKKKPRKIKNDINIVV